MQATITNRLNIRLQIRHTCRRPIYPFPPAGLRRVILLWSSGSREALQAIELVRFAGDFVRPADLFDEEDEDMIHGFVPQLQRAITAFYRDYHLPLDLDIFVRMLEMYRDNVDPAFHPGFFDNVRSEFGGDFRIFGEDLFINTVFTRESELTSLVGDFGEDAAGVIRNDPMAAVIGDIRAVYNDYVIVERQEINNELNVLYKCRKTHKSF